MEWGINFTAWPEMLAWPYLLLNGWLPYKDIAIAHNPLLIAVLSLFYKMFGVGILQLKIFTWVLIFLNSYLTYFVTSKFWNKKKAILASTLYLLLCITFEGNGLWFDLALVPFALLLYYFVKLKKYVLAGIIFALGFFTKQTFIYFLIPLLLSEIKDKKTLLGRSEKFLTGSVVIGILFLLSMFVFGIADDFYLWAVKFGIFYLPGAEGQVLLPTLKQFIFSVAPFLVLFLDFSLLPWVLAGVAGVYPRFELFHFQPALPFLAIAISNVVFSKQKVFIKSIIAVFIFIFLFLGLKRQMGTNTRFLEPEVIKVTNEISKVEVKEIYVINYWDNIYALTNTSPATKPLIPYIPWYLNYANDKELIINNLKLKMPEIIVLGQRDIIFPEIYDLVEKYYLCNSISGSIELCYKNK